MGRLIRAGVGVLAVVAVAGISAVAVAAAPTAPAAGHIFINATGSDGPAGTIVIVGAIGDHGKTLSIDKNGKPDSNGNFVKIMLQKGSFEVDATALNTKMSKLAPTVNKTTCSFMISGSAPVRFFNGTGLYKGIKGQATITTAYGVLGPLYASGPHKGQCNGNNNAKSVAQFGTISGPGTVSFG